MHVLNGASAIYLQIKEYFEVEIASGRLEPGSKLDPIRTLAVNFKVNPNTIQKALAELERDELLVTDRTNGKYVTSDANRVKVLKDRMAIDLVCTFIGSAEKLGLNQDKINQMIEKGCEDYEA